jgi:hypothetical protein
VFVKPPAERPFSYFDQTEQFRNQVSDNVKRNRVESKNFKWFRPPSIALDIDDPVTQRQKL